MRNNAIIFSIEVMKNIDGQELKALAPDENGVYRGVPLGVVGAASRNNASYDRDSMINCLTGEDQIFAIKLREGNLLGEYGHPDQIGSRQEQILRMYKVDPTKVSHAILRTEMRPTKNGEYTLITGDIKPCGPYGKYLDESFQDPLRNTAFSIRSLTAPRKNPNQDKKVLAVISFDAVEGPGFGQASKRYVSMESAMPLEEVVHNKMVMESLGLESQGIDELYDLVGASKINVIGNVLGFDGTNFISDGKKMSVFQTLFKRR